MQAIVAVLLFLAAPLAAEYRRVEVHFSGMQCSSCASTVVSRLQRMRGVEAVNPSLDQGRIEVILKPENAVRLDNIRDTVKNAGFTLGDTNVSVRGTAIKEGERWQFRVEGSGETVHLKAPLEAAGVAAVTGVVRGDLLEVSSVESSSAKEK